MGKVGMYSNITTLNGNNDFLTKNQLSCQSITFSR